MRSHLILFSVPGVVFFSGAVQKANKRTNKTFKRAFLNIRKRDQVLNGSDNDIND